MASTAELLFSISTESGDAEENVQRFRELLGKNLSDLSGEFSNWSEEVFGDLSTFEGAMLGVTAGIAAGVAVAVGAIHEADQEYDNFMADLQKGRQVTGLSVEALAGLHDMALQTGVQFDTVVRSLGLFEANIGKAAEGSTTQQQAFKNLGVSQQDVIAGQSNLLPLLMKVMDGFEKDKSAVDRATLARGLFGRGGMELLPILAQGSAALREQIEEIKKHNDVTDADLDSYNEMKAAQRAMQKQTEALDLAIGNLTVGFRTWWQEVELTLMKILSHPLSNWVEEWKESKDEIKKTADAIKAAGQINDAFEGTLGKGVKAATENYTGLTSIVDSLASRIAATEGPWQRVMTEVAKYHEELFKASDELDKLQAAGKITADSFTAQTAALAKIPAMISQFMTAEQGKIDKQAEDEREKLIEKSVEAEERKGDMLAQLHQQLVEKVSVIDAQDYDQKRAKLQKEIDDLTAHYAKEGALTEENEALITQLKEQGLDKISKDQNTAFQKELSSLTQHLEADVAATMTGQQKLYMEYQKSLEQYGQIEEQKALKTAQTEAEAETIREFYARIRSSLTLKYQNDLQTLLNSQGWQGVFGNSFGQLIKGNEALFREWSTSANQGLLMVRMSLEALKEQSQQTFLELARGMGNSITQAAILEKSIGQAMRSALASVLESIAGQNAAYAIQSLGLGFYDLSLGLYDKAGQAFTAAGIFGSAATIDALAGRAIAPSQVSSTAVAAGSATNPATDTSTAAAASTTAPAPSVSIHIEGSVIGPSGISELTDMINQAVYGNDVTLYASHDAQGNPLQG